VTSFRLGSHGSLTAVDTQNTTYNSLDDALTQDNKFLYVLSNQLLPTAGPHSAIDAFKVNASTGKLSHAGSSAIAGNNTAGLAVF
jgi:6-phosphogluconolactonase (cycloisomerase 2 family)